MSPLLNDDEPTANMAASLLFVFYFNATAITIVISCQNPELTDSLKFTINQSFEQPFSPYTQATFATISNIMQSLPF